MRGKNWTTSEIRAASNLWKQGKTIVEIAAELKRSREGVKHQIQYRRDDFPRRKQAQNDLKDTTEIKLVISAYVHQLIRAEARARGISINMVVRETFRDRFVRKLWKPQERMSTAKVKYSNGSPV